MDPPDTPATRTHRSRRGILATVGWLVAELAVGAGLVAALIALSTTEPGLRAGLALLQRLAPFAIEFDGVSGALNDGFGIDRLRFVGGRATVEIERLRVRVGAVALRTPGLEFESVRAERVRVVIAPSTAPTAEPPQTLALPIALRVARLAVGRFELHNGAAALALATIDGSVAFGPDGWRVDHGRFDAAGMPVTLDAKLAAAAPFALDARGTIGAAVAEKPVQARWQASGQLLDIDLAADLTGGGARGHAVARVAALADPPLKSLDVDVRGIVPRAWNAAWPVATVDLRAALKPELGATPGSAASAGIGDITLAGSVDVVNYDPGTIDAGRVPLRQASARIRLSRSALHVDTLRALLRRGAASGSASLRWDGAPSWQAQLRLDAVDPAAIHAAARSLSIDGRASLGHDRGTTRIDADLHHRRAPAVDARVAGFNKKAKELGFVLVSDAQYSHNQAAEGAKVISAALAKDADLAGVFATNLFTAQGVATGVKQAGKSGTVKVVGFDAGPDQMKQLAAGDVQALVAQKPFDIGKQGVEQALAALSGGSVTAKIETESLVVTKDNMAQPDVAKYIYKSSC